MSNPSSSTLSRAHASRDTDTRQSNLPLEPQIAASRSDNTNEEVVGTNSSSTSSSDSRNDGSVGTHTDIALSDDADGQSASPTLPVLQIIRHLNSGQLCATELSIDSRRACVAHMTDEGFSACEIADVLRTTERTVHRDRAALRQFNAIEPNLRLGDEMLGELQRLTCLAIQKLTRLANDHNATPYTRLYAPEAICRVYERFMKMANAMEYLEHGDGRLRELNAKERKASNVHEGHTPLAQPGELDVLRRLMMVK